MKRKVSIKMEKDGYKFIPCSKELRCSRCYFADKDSLCKAAKCTPEEGVEYGYYFRVKPVHRTYGVPPMSDKTGIKFS